MAIGEAGMNTNNGLHRLVAALQERADSLGDESVEGLEEVFAEAINKSAQEFSLLDGEQDEYVFTELAVINFIIEAARAGYDAKQMRSFLVEVLS